MKFFRHFLFLLVSVLFVVFVFRLIFLVRFDNVITNDTYFEFNFSDNSINNLDEINVSSKGFFNLIRNFNLHFSDLVDTMSSYNVFDIVADSLDDIPLLGRFFSFMGSVYSLIVYLVSMVLSLLSIVLDVFKYIFSIETIDVVYDTVSIPNVG